MDTNSLDGKAHFHSSPRFWGVLTGNGANGNNLPDPWDAARKYGVLPYEDLPVSSSMTVAEYYASIPRKYDVQGGAIPRVHRRKERDTVPLGL